MKKLVVLEPLSVPDDVLEGMLQEKLGDQVEWTLYDHRAASDEEMIERAKDAEIVVIANQPMSANVMEHLEKIELLAVAFTGFDHIPMDVCKAKGVTVCNASGYSNEAVTDLVFGMTITLLRNIRECDKVVREGGTMAGLVGQELSALKFGVVGCGHIAQQVLKVAQAFGCDCYAYNRSPKEVEGVTFVDLDTLMSTCDVVSVHLAMNDQTRGFIGKKQIDEMKPTAILINCARGPIVDIEALAQALNEGRLGGAGIDVFYTEPPLEAGHPLFTTPHTLLTPHVAFATDEAFVKRAHIVADNIAAFLAGSSINVVG